ncbi:MAG: hypothetical protein GHCLOJNM_02873 [bacterium]|nr:hypothetical protein [bacterium]
MTRLSVPLGTLLFFLHSLFPIPHSFAAIPLQMNHQGVIKVGGNPFNGNGDFRFALIDPDTGLNRWTNDGTQLNAVGTPTNPVNLPVINGIYNVRLGDASLTNMIPIQSSVFDDDNIVLRVWFDDGTANGNQQLMPDQKVTSAGYAFHAVRAETAGDADTVNGIQASALLLTGEVRMWAGPISAIPSGWLLCDGSAISRTTYANLFGVLGTIYGIGDGTTTFNLPDLRDRSPMGARQDDSGVPKTNVTGALTQTGGEATHTLTESEIPAHSHGQVFNGPWGFSGTGGSYNEPSASYTPGRTTQLFTDSTGGGQPHNVLDPYFAVVFIIKT